MTDLLKTITELQTKTMETAFENAKNLPETLTTLFGTSTEAFKTSWMTNTNAKAMYENNKKFHTAYVNYNKAVAEMLEATYSNIELINKETTKSN